ncbi:MAG TPA: polyketide synthase dehydratase domain-containing protein, partial [Mycobacterium sp.]|nr:polyketide synthase dehydratase domain-containing protein [Mycobacterium sp.]
MLAPLVLSADGAVRLQVVVGVDGDSGDRPVSVYSQAVESDSVWTLHAEGAVSVNPVAVETTPMTVWPPEAAVAVELADAYHRLAEEGYQYGPAFRGLRAMWQRGDETFAEIALPADVVGLPGGFVINPVLLDAALHAVLLSGSPGQLALPYCWEGVTLHAADVAALRVRILRSDGESATLDLTDESGLPVMTVQSVRMRPVAAGQFDTTAAGTGSLLEVTWSPVPAAPAAATAPPAVYQVEGGGDDPVASVYRATHRALSTLQDWLSNPVGTLVMITRGAMALPGEDVTDLAGAAVWGLVRSAQTEHPGRVVLVDTDAEVDAEAAVALGEPQVLIRAGQTYVARLAEAQRPQAGEAEAPWRMTFDGSGTLDRVVFETIPPDERPLGSGQVRVDVHAVGVNFRDVLIALGMYPDADVQPGAEAAGVVVEVGPGVSGLAPGDRVMGLLLGVGRFAVADQRLLVRMPEHWTMTEAASVPAVFLTAYYALADVAEVRAGQSLLVHAATGGVGMAAVQLARHWGLEVFGTASVGKWGTLRQIGFDDSHIGDSRTLEFSDRFAAVAGQRGIDVVLNCLSGDFIDASLRLIRDGGSFVEMGKTDIRDMAAIHQRYPGIRYQTIDLFYTDPDRIQQMLVELVRLFETGALQPLPIKTWPVRRAAEAYRFVRQARHIGKVVLQVRADLAGGTVLVTGGTGMAGAAVARHLVGHHGVRRLLLISRQGMRAAGAADVVSELTAAGATVEVVSCDVTDR